MPDTIYIVIHSFGDKTLMALFHNVLQSLVEDHGCHRVCVHRKLYPYYINVYGQKTKYVFEFYTGYGVDLYNRYLRGLRLDHFYSTDCDVMEYLCRLYGRDKGINDLEAFCKNFDVV